MKKVLLVRHANHAEVGRVLSGRSEIELSAQGGAEAESLAEVLEGVAVASLHCSPRRRARETIAPLATRRGLPVTITPALDEIDFGDFTRRAFAALDGDPAWFRWNAERDTARCPGGETMADAVARCTAYLDALTLEAFPALCVTHCDVIRGVVAQVLGLEFQRMFAFDCDPASRTTLDWVAGDRRLVTLNERVRG